MFIIAIVGPTATGKSDLALTLAEHDGAVSGTPGQIVNADAFALYREMDLGTAKTLADAQRGIVHHQIDVLDPSQDASVAHFQRAARQDIAEIQAQGARPIIAGGSGLYVRALVDQIEFPGTDADARSRLEERAAVVGPRVLHDELTRLDPVAAESIGPANTKRIVRALEVIELTGKPFSANLPVREYVRPTIQIGLDCPRDVLDQRVADRVEAMWEAGLVAEVRGLAERGLGRTASRAVGYAEVLAFLRGEISEVEAREAVVTHTRRLTRKQMGWFGRDPRIHWLHATDPDLVERALDLVSRADAGRLDEPGPQTGTVRRPLGS